MAKSINGELFEKNGKIILKCKSGFIYERIVYCIRPKLVYALESKLLGSNKFLDDSHTCKVIQEERYLICLELYAATKKWIDDNGFVVFDESKTVRKKKSKQLVKFAKQLKSNGKSKV